MDEFFIFAKKKKVKIEEGEYEKSKKLIDTQLNALFARNLYSVSAYFEIINELNDSYISVIAELMEPSFEKDKNDRNKYNKGGMSNHSSNDLF